MKFRIFVATAVVAIVLVGSLAGYHLYAAIEDDYQAAADAKRINDVHRIAALVEAFVTAAGHHPLRGRLENSSSRDQAEPMAANITGLKLPSKYLRPPPGQPGQIIPSEEFEAELRAVLGAEVVIPYDPQRVGVYAPNFYQFMTVGGNWYVSANLYSPTEHTLELGPHYHKYQVSSASTPQMKVRRFADIPAEELEAARIAGERAEGSFPQ